MHSSHRLRQVFLATFAASLAAHSSASAQAAGPAVPPEQTLRGMNAIALEVVALGDRIPEAELRAIVERELRNVGIEVRPAGSFPALRLEVNNRLKIALNTRDTRGSNYTVTYDIFTAELRFDQLLTGGNQRVRATTWRESRSGWGGAQVVARTMREAVEGIAADFTRAFRGVNAGAPAIAGPEPTVREQGMIITYDYGRVPRDFHPPIPELPPGKHVQLRMEKQTAGALVSVSLGFGDPTDLAGDREAYQRIYRDRQSGRSTREYDLYMEDVRALASHRLITCRYRQAAGFQVRRYWFRTRPAAADPARLRARIADHPMLGLPAEPRERCPLD